MSNEYLKIDNQLCFRLYSTSRKMTRLYQPFLEKFNLTYPQYIVMLVMFEHREIDFKDLSNIVDLKTGTLTPIIQKLVSIGYLNKVKNTKDSRKINISLTEAGVLLEKNILEVPVGLGNKLEISEEMYFKLTKELDDLTLLLRNASIKEEK
jgi:DNA-binding MarR family transcriptional regulator